MGVGAEKRQCLSPAPFSAHRKFAQIGPKPAQNPSLGQGCYPSPKEATQRLTRANTRDFYVGCLWDDTTSRRKRMCAFTACVRFLRRRGPAGLRSRLFCGYSVVIFALPVVCPKHGNIHVAIGVHNVFSNSPESGSKSFSWAGMLPSPKESHTAAHRGKYGGFLCGVLIVGQRQIQSVLKTF